MHTWLASPPPQRILEWVWSLVSSTGAPWRPRDIASSSASRSFLKPQTSMTMPCPLVADLRKESNVCLTVLSLRALFPCTACTPLLIHHTLMAYRWTTGSMIWARSWSVPGLCQREEMNGRAGNSLQVLVMRGRVNCSSPLLLASLI